MEYLFFSFKWERGKDLKTGYNKYLSIVGWVKYVGVGWYNQVKLLEK